MTLYGYDICIVDEGKGADKVEEDNDNKKSEDSKPKLAFTVPLKSGTIFKALEEEKSYSGSKLGHGSAEAPCTKSGRQVWVLSWLIKEMGVVKLTNAKQKYYGLDMACTNYYAVLAETSRNELAKGELEMVSAGIGNGFENTKELCVMNYNKAMATPDKGEYHKVMVRHKIWTPVAHNTLPKVAKVINSTWAMKKKPNNMYRARMNAKGFKQIEARLQWLVIGGTCYK